MSLPHRYHLSPSSPATTTITTTPSITTVAATAATTIIMATTLRSPRTVATITTQYLVTITPTL